jgi:DNA-binding LacI/PurR family transcriptional regulator
MPVLMINDYMIGSNVYSVMTDETEGAFQAVKYLIKLGHKKIAFINGDVDYTTYLYKLRGYERALEANGIEFDEKYHIKQTPYEEGGYLGTKKILQMKEDRPTAIFTASDQIAVGVYKAIYEAGLKIPLDFSVVGFSGIPLSKELFPELTTVDQFAYNTGSKAGRTLMKLIAGETLEQKRILLEPKLIIRNSCKNISEI